MGFGSCVKACQFGAIHVEDGIAVVDKEKCCLLYTSWIAPMDGSRGDPKGLAGALLMLAAVYAVGVAANYAQAKVMLTVAQNALQKIRNELFGKMKKRCV